MEIKTFNLSGKNTATKPKNKLFRRDMNSMNKSYNNIPATALYNVLRHGGSLESIILRPDLFSGVKTDGDAITISSFLYVPTKCGHVWRFFIPFTDEDILIEDFQNGVFEIYPKYRILILENMGKTDFSTLSDVGVFDMSSAIYEDIMLTENWESVKTTDIAKHADETIITRQSPVSIPLTPNMRNFYSNLKDNKIKLNF